MALTIATVGFNSDYLSELSICECWLIYFHYEEQRRLKNYLEYPKDKNGKDLEYNQMYIWRKTS